MTTTTYTRDDTGEMLPVRVAEQPEPTVSDTPIFDSLAHLPGADNTWRRQAGLSHARFDGMGIRDVEHPSESAPSLEVPAGKPTEFGEWAELPDGPPDLIGLGVGPALRGRYGSKGSPSPFDPTPAPDENMPGRVAPTSRDGLQEQAERYARQQALRQAAERGTATGTYHLPALEPSIEGTYVRAGGAVDWRAEWAALKADLARPLRWWLRKQAQRNERMGTEQ